MIPFIYRRKNIGILPPATTIVVLAGMLHSDPANYKIERAWEHAFTRVGVRVGVGGCALSLSRV